MMMNMISTISTFQYLYGRSMTMLTQDMLWLGRWIFSGILQNNFVRTFTIITGIIVFLYMYCPITRNLIDDLIDYVQVKVKQFREKHRHHERNLSKLCPRRLARYYKCECRRRKRRQRHQNHHDLCLSLFSKIHLPPPLPLRKKVTHEHEPQQQAVQQDETLTTRQEDEEDVENKYKNDGRASTIEEHISSEQDINNNPTQQVNDTYDVVTTSHYLAQPPQLIQRTLSVHLIDLVRMQQWNVILQQQSRFKRKEAKFRDSDGLYPLHWAAAGGPPVSVLRVLVDTYPSAVRKTDNEGSMPLHFATHYSASVDCIQLLIKTYPEAVRYQDKYGRTPLYHATDKSASLDVLQSLVKTDPDMITVPCFHPTRMQWGNKSASFTREIAMRTPLYVIWGSVISDRRTRTTRRGKKWDKAIWMLQEYYKHRFGNTQVKNDVDDSCNILLQATIHLDLYLPEQVLSMMIASFPELLRIPDTLGRIPIATAAAMVNPYSLERMRDMLQELFSAYPDGAKFLNSKNGRSALWEAIAAGHPLQVFLHSLLDASKDHLQTRDGCTGLPPALLAAQATRIQEVAVTSPTVRDFDPFNLLSEKTKASQENLQLEGKLLNISLLEYQDEISSTHLSTIYELLLANPTQLVST